MLWPIGPDMSCQVLLAWLLPLTSRRLCFWPVWGSLCGRGPALHNSEFKMSLLFHGAPLSSQAVLALLAHMVSCCCRCVSTSL